MIMVLIMEVIMSNIKYSATANGRAITVAAVESPSSVVTKLLQNVLRKKALVRLGTHDISC